MRMPELQGEAAAAVAYREGAMQIIAGAGAGKTEVVSQRVASLITEGVPPQSIVAFTFTERAAAELKDRIALRVLETIGASAVDRLAGLFVGTIHAYCFRLLQRHVPKFEAYDVLDENQQTAFLAREASRLDIALLSDRGAVYDAIERFRRAMDVVENELIDVCRLPEPLQTIACEYYAALDRYRLLTYGQQIVQAVEALSQGEVATLVHSELQHLIVDEYQDVNPAQERLVSLLVAGGAHACVVGDDDQAVYQWRGSDVANIVTFSDRYADCRSFRIVTNRRSRPGIIRAANAFVETIPGRLEKAMEEHRPALGEAPTVTLLTLDHETDEAASIADVIVRLHEDGLPYRDVAILVRSGTSYAEILRALASRRVPVQPGGRLGLFSQPEAQCFARTYSWLANEDWGMPREPRSGVLLPDLVTDLRRTFDCGAAEGEVTAFLEHWRDLAEDEGASADLIGEFYDFLELLGVASWDLDDPLTVARLGAVARFSQLLSDYEAVRRRSRRDSETIGEQVGGEVGNHWYYRNLSRYLVNYAQSSYEGFGGEDGVGVDAVDVTTIHRAKGLEWPVVFVPCMTSLRFPSTRTGRQQEWLVPRTMFNADRYEGSDQDERRLFYVAITRARDWVVVSRHARLGRAIAPSPYFMELGAHEVAFDTLEMPTVEPRPSDEDEPVTITYSQLAQFIECGYAFRLRAQLGFQPRLAVELGYGKAVHHVMRAISDHTRRTGAVPDTATVQHLLDQDFFLPVASKAAHRQMKAAALRLINRYVEHHADDLARTWETERPFELHLDGVVVSGRADVILDRGEERLAILDYKTSVDERDLDGLQLLVYTDAGRREGLDVSAAYLHDLGAGTRVAVPIDEAAIESGRSLVKRASLALRQGQFEPKPGPRCATCEVRRLCRARAA